MNKHQAIILAAGFSTRMGTCKADLPWKEGHTLLSYQSSRFLRAGIIPIVVLGNHNLHSRQHCPPGSQIALNPNANEGKTSSILTGLKVLPDAFETVTISAVDQPRSVSVYERLLRAYQMNPSLIVAPVYREKIGHPLLFCRSALPYLLNIQEARKGLRAIIQEFYTYIRFIEWDTPEVLTDLNSPDAYYSAYFSQVSTNLIDIRP